MTHKEKPLAPSAKPEKVSTNDITEIGLPCKDDGIRGMDWKMRKWCELNEYELNMQEGVNSRIYCNNWNEEEANCKDYYWSYINDG